MKLPKIGYRILFPLFALLIFIFLIVGRNSGKISLRTKKVAPSFGKVEVLDNFEGARIWTANQTELDKAKDFVFQAIWEKTNGVVENFLIPRCDSDKRSCSDIPVKINLSRGIKLIFTDFENMTSEEAQGYKEGVPVYSEARARYDVTPEGQLTMEVFSLRSTKNYMYAARASYALQQFLVGPGVNVLSLPYPFIFKTIMGDLPKTQGGNGEYNPAIQAEFE